MNQKGEEMTNSKIDDELEYSDTLNDDDNNEEIPKEERKLITQAYDKSVSDLFTMMQEDDIILNPDYQRDYIWDNKKASLLIESILLNVPIPVVYMSEEEDGRWSVIDGLQRLNSLKRFFENEFKLTGLEVLSELQRTAYKDLNPKAKRVIKNGIIRIILIFKESNSEIKYDIFMRLNTGSVKLSEQELRNCLYRGDLNDLLKKLRGNKKYLKILGLAKPHKRMNDAELILRYLAISENIDRNEFTIKEYPGKMKTFLNDFSDNCRKMDATYRDSLEAKFNQTLDKVHAIFGDKAFRRIDVNGNYDRILNRSVMDAVMIGFEPYNLENLVAKKTSIIELLKTLTSKDVDFMNSISIGTSDRKQIERRINIFSNKIKELVLGI